LQEVRQNLLVGQIGRPAVRREDGFVEAAVGVG
jgi:hypothetical protein